MPAGVAEIGKRISQSRNVKAVSANTLSQAINFAASAGRIPLVLFAIGTKGYGIVIALVSISPWFYQIVSSLTVLTRVSVSERLGVRDYAGSIRSVQTVRRTALRMAFGIALVMLVIAVAIPWPSIVHAHGVSSDLQIRLSIIFGGLLCASSTPGAVYVGLLHARRKVATTNLFPGIASILTLLIAAVGWALHLPLSLFVVATAVGSSAPFWFGAFLGRREMIALRADEWSDQAPDQLNVEGRSLKARQLFVMSAAGAPPLFSTGLDPIVLSLATGPLVVAAYGLATRLDAVITLIPSALYPLFWADFGRLRSGGSVEAIQGALKRTLKMMVPATAVLALGFVLFGPLVAHLVSGNKVAHPFSLYAGLGILGILASVQSVTMPVLGGFRTAPKFAALWFALIVPNEALSYVLAKHVGAAGPIYASIGTSLILLSVCYATILGKPSVLADRREQDRGGPEYGDGMDGEPDAVAFVPNGNGFAVDPDRFGLHRLGGIGPHVGAIRQAADAALNSTPSTEHGGSLRSPEVFQAIDPREYEPSDVADQRKLVSRVAWIAALLLCIGSPSLVLIQHASALRGLVLIAIPFFGIWFVLKGLPRRIGRRSESRMNNLVLLFALVVVLQVISAMLNIGVTYTEHIFPALALCILGFSGRLNLSGITKDQYRSIITTLVLPFSTILAFSWIAQELNLVHALLPTSLHILGVHGKRLQGLFSTPNALGFFSGIVVLIAVCAERRFWVNCAIGLGLLTLLASDSRTALLATAVGVFLYWWFGPAKQYGKRWAVALAGLVLAPVGWGVIDVVRTNAQGVAAQGVLTGRSTIWANAYHLAISAGWLGSGPEAVARIAGTTIAGHGFTSQAQNQWLNDTINFGLLEMLVLCAFVLAAYLTVDRSIKVWLYGPLVMMFVIDAISEDPLNLWSSSTAAFPIFLLIFLSSRGRSSRSTTPFANTMHSGADESDRSPPVDVRVRELA